MFVSTPPRLRPSTVVLVCLIQLPAVMNGNKECAGRQSQALELKNMQAGCACGTAINPKLKDIDFGPNAHSKESKTVPWTGVKLRRGQ